MASVSIREFHRPADEAAALNLLQRGSPAAAPLWIGPRVPDRLHAGLETVVDLSRLGLNFILQEGDLIRIGALTPLQALADSDLLRGFAGGIVAKAARFSAGSALRQAATVGGAISLSQQNLEAGQAGPPELILAFLALDAGLVYAAGNGGAQPVSINQDSKPPERGFLVEVDLAFMRSAEAGALARLARSPRDQAIVAAAAVVSMRGGSVERLTVAVSGAGERPVRLEAVGQALVGQQLTPDTLSHMQAQVAALVEPRADYLGSADYRREMAGLLARRAVEAAAAHSLRLLVKA